MRVCEAALERGRLRPGDPPADGARGHVAAAARGDGVAHAGRAARGGAHARPRRRAAPASAEPRRTVLARPRRPPARRRRRVIAPFDASESRARPERRACAGSSSPGPTPVSGKTVVAAAVVAPRCAPAGERVAAFKPVVTGLDEPPSPIGRPTTSCSRRRRAGATARGRAAPLRAAGVAAPGRRARPASARARGAACAAARGAPSGADVLVVEGVGGLLVPLTRGYLVRDLARELGAAARRRRPAGPRHDQPHAADARGRRGAAGLDVAAVVLTPWPDEPGASRPPTATTIARLGDVEVATLRARRPGRAELLAAAGALAAARPLAGRGLAIAAARRLRAGLAEAVDREVAEAGLVAEASRSSSRTASSAAGSTSVTRPQRSQTRYSRSRPRASA